MISLVNMKKNSDLEYLEESGYEEVGGLCPVAMSRLLCSRSFSNTTHNKTFFSARLYLE